MKANAQLLVLSIAGMLIAGMLLLAGCSQPKACTEEAKICPDGSSVVRTGPNCEFSACPQSKLKANECYASDRDIECSDIDSPVCGWFNQSIKCLKYPCAANYGSPCWACSVPQVAYWTEGPCPRSDEEMRSACENADGEWLSKSKECEGISQEKCIIVNGEFNECASACRNDPNAKVCTLQCVQVCQFKT